MCQCPKLQISGGFCLLIAWFGLINGWELLLVVLLAATLHEIGHCVILLALGAQIRRIRLGVCGAVLETDSSCTLSYGGELAAVLAGPGANFLCASLLLAWDSQRWALAAGANLILCVFNLLPLRPLDGGRAWYLLSSWLFGPRTGERTTRWVGTVTGLMLALGLVTVMRYSGSLWLLPPLFGILNAVWRENAGQIENL